MPLIPLSWLNDHVDVPADTTAETLAAALVKVGLEEEAIHTSDVTGPVVVGQVLTLVKEEQKNGKTINYCRVDVGQYNDAPGEGKEPSDLESRGIICGAHNFVEGDYVVVSLPGAVLPGGFAIAARKTYGHISDGMICSAAELGLGESSDGIIVLAHKDEQEKIDQLPAVGEDALEYLGLTGETLEINITPDRGYCFSMRGVGREFAHSTGASFTDRGLPENLDHELPVANSNDVVVDDQTPIHGVPGCSRFVTRVVTGVDPTRPSPKWMQDRLIEAGQRPISLAVDATNYVMLDLGQPLHAYDLDQVQLPLVVRRAKAGEKLTTLDDVERTLDPEDLLITDTDGTRVLGLAGVMGGASTEVTDQTVNVLIEAAHFDQVSVARSARRHRLPSEAAKRFERGVDPQLPPVAADRVAELLVEYGGGTIASPVTDLNNVEAPEPITFNTGEVARLTGLNLDDATITAYLKEIGCVVESDQVTPPSWRPDLTGPAHLVEEVARLVGYDEIESILPSAPAGHGHTLEQRRRSDMMRSLVEHGWVEVLSYPFISAAVFDKQELDSDDERRTALKLVNPLQDEYGLMRTSILDSLLTTAALNVSRSNPDVAIVEAGLVTRPGGITPAEVLPGGVRPSDEALAGLENATPHQPHHIGGVATPSVYSARAGFETVTWDWRDAIEAVKTLASTIGAQTSVANATYPPFHPGRCAEVKVGQTIIGYAGELAPSVCQAFNLPARSIAFEVDTTALHAARGDSAIEVRPVATNPVAKEDMAFVVKSSVDAAAMEDVIRRAGGDLLEEVYLFDVYTGEQVGQDMKSLAFALRFRGDHTLKQDEINAIRKTIIKRVQGELGATLR